MQLLITTDAINSAPAEVKNWLLEQLFGKPPTPVQPDTSVIDSPKGESPHSMDQILDRARQLLEAKGEEALSEVLKKVGIRRVKECPEEKYAELMAELAVHA